MKLLIDILSVISLELISFLHRCSMIYDLPELISQGVGLGLGE
jgi:hypothetical protein